jgi:hypothetical protein
MHFNFFFVKIMHPFLVNWAVIQQNGLLFKQHNQNALDFLQFVTYKARRCLSSSYFLACFSIIATWVLETNFLGRLPLLYVRK